MKKFTYFLIALLLISMIGEITSIYALNNQTSQNTNSNKHVSYQINNPSKNSNVGQNQYVPNQKSQNQPMTTIYKNTDNTYLNGNNQNSLMPSQITTNSINLDAAISTVDVFYITGYNVQGILTDNVGTPVPSTTVYLYLDSVLSYTQVTNSSGGYSFPLTFNLANVGSQINATVYYPSIDGPSYLLAGKVQIVYINVKNKAALTVTKVTPVSNTFGPGTTYTIQATLKTIDPSQTDVDPNSAYIQVTYTETFNTNSTQFYSTTAPFSSGTSSYSKSFGYNEAISYTITGSIDPVLAASKFPNIIFNPIDCSKSIIVTISLDVTFNLIGKIGGASIIDSSYYYRTGQSLTFDGQLTTSTVGLDLSNHAYSITVYRGPTGTETIVGTSGGTTNSTGGFSYTAPVFSTTYYPNPEDIVKIIAIVTSSPGSFITIVPSTANYTLNIKDNIAGLSAKSVTPAVNATGIIPNTVYYPGTLNTIAITGTVHDQNGLAANGVTLQITLNDHKYPNDPSVIGSSVILTSSVVTASDGTFSYTINVPSTGISSYALTIRISYITDSVWQNPSGNYSEVATFQYTNAILTSVQDNTGGSFANLPTGTPNNINILNNTLDGYFIGGSLFQTTIRDTYGRLPTGLSAIFTMTYIDGSGNTVETFPVAWTVSSGNNGFQSINLFTYNNSILTTILNQWGAKVQIVIQIAYNDALITTETYSKTYIIYGPDHAPPVISQIQTNGVFTNSSFYEITNNVLIQVNLGLGGTQQYTNIRNVTIYYRFSTNFVNSESLADFTGVSYSTALMTLVNGGGNGEYWQYSIAFPGNGQWIQFYVIAYDKAGYGIDQNYNSPGTPYAGYNSAVSNTVTSSTYKLVTGDITIDKNFDLNTRVRLNGTQLGSVITLQRFQNVQITLDLITDASGYNTVTIYWRYLTFDLKGALVSYTSYTNSPMAFLLSTTINAVNYQRYTFTTPDGKTKLDWLVQLDFYFVYSDNSINSATTSSTVKVVGGNQAQDITNPSKVIDVNSPTGTQNTASSGFPIAGRNNTATLFQMWSNESVNFIYNITDNNGIGVSNVTLFIYVNGSLSQTINLMLNGAVLYNGITGLDAYGSLKNFYYFNYTLSLNNYNNSIVSWSILATDGMGNPITFNAQGPTAQKFDVLPPPVVNTGNPTVTTSYYTTTDSNGNTITTFTVITKGIIQSARNNALIIVLGFILGLLVLILYYQRNNIREVLARRARKKRVESTLKELTEEIMRLGAEGKYHRAILLTWEALERVSREIIQAPRRYNQSAREFALYLSTITIVDRETLLTLSEVYEKARYGKSGSVEEDDFDDAVKALDITVRTIIESGARFRIDEEDEEFE